MAFFGLFKQRFTYKEGQGITLVEGRGRCQPCSDEYLEIVLKALKDFSLQFAFDIQNGLPIVVFENQSLVEALVRLFRSKELFKTKEGRQEFLSILRKHARKLLKFILAYRARDDTVLRARAEKFEKYMKEDRPTFKPNFTVWEQFLNGENTAFFPFDRDLTGEGILTRQSCPMALFHIYTAYVNETLRIANKWNLNLESVERLPDSWRNQTTDDLGYTVRPKFSVPNTYRLTSPGFEDVHDMLNRPWALVNVLETCDTFPQYVQDITSFRGGELIMWDQYYFDETDV